MAPTPETPMAIGSVEMFSDVAHAPQALAEVSRSDNSDWQQRRALMQARRATRPHSVFSPRNASFAMRGLSSLRPNRFASSPFRSLRFK